MGLIIEVFEFDFQNVHTSQNVYLFLFGVQIILLVMRGLALYSNTIYMGTLLKIIKLMLIEILKFLSIFLIIMMGFVFGLYLMNAANECRSDELQDDHEHDCSEYEVLTLSDAIQYVLQVFLGLGDFDGVVDQGMQHLFHLN